MNRTASAARKFNKQVDGIWSRRSAAAKPGSGRPPKGPETVEAIMLSVEVAARDRDDVEVDLWQE